MHAIEYIVNKPITVDEFIELLHNSSLGQRRPVNDRSCIQGMLENANLLVTARHEGKLVGVARSVTDFHYCCYLSDLAVGSAFQRRGIGKQLIRLTRAELGERCTLILLAAPAAVDYYPHLNFEHHPQAWILKPGAAIT
ncbi:MAG TPA: GNAT family N-acetyltransferase [Gemmataceae bacterium]|nr:GNAT family N-acetyltransferase [Gemmataceae bacterium]